MCSEQSVFLKPRTQKGCLQINNVYYPLYEGLNSIGRTKNATVIIKNENVSQNHAMITVVDGEHYISDMGSINGTFLNKDKLQPLLLYKLTDESIAHFASITAIYKKEQNLNTAAEACTQGLNESVFLASTQQLASANTQNDDSCFDDDYNFDALDIVENKEKANAASIHDMPTQIFDLELQKPETSGYNVTFSNLPTQIFDQITESSETQMVVVDVSTTDSLSQQPIQINNTEIGCFENKTVSLHDSEVDHIDTDKIQVSAEESFTKHLVENASTSNQNNNNIHNLPTQVKTNRLVAYASTSKQSNEHLYNLPPEVTVEDSKEKFDVNASATKQNNENIHNSSTQVEKCSKFTNVGLQSCNEDSNRETDTLARVPMHIDDETDGYCSKRNSEVDISNDVIDATIIDEASVAVELCEEYINKDTNALNNIEDSDIVRHAKKKCLPLPSSCESILEDGGKCVETSKGIVTKSTPDDLVEPDSETDDDLDISQMRNKISGEENVHQKTATESIDTEDCDIVTPIKKKCKPLPSSESSSEDNPKSTSQASDDVILVTKRNSRMIIESDSETDDELDIPQMLNEKPKQDESPTCSKQTLNKSNDLDVAKSPEGITLPNVFSDSDTDIEEDIQKPGLSYITVNETLDNSNVGDSPSISKKEVEQMNESDVIIPGTQMSDNDDNDFDFRTKQNSRISEFTQESFSLRLSSYFELSDEIDKVLSEPSITSEGKIDENLDDKVSKQSIVSANEKTCDFSNDQINPHQPLDNALFVQPKQKVLRSQNGSTSETAMSSNNEKKISESNSIFDVQTQAMTDTSSKFSDNQQDILVGKKDANKDLELENIQEEIFAQPTQKPNEYPHTNKQENDNVFDQPTQNITETDPKNHSNKKIDDDVFDQPTQIITETDPKNHSNKMIDDNVFDQPTQVITETVPKNHPSRKIDDEVFDQPTQIITETVPKNHPSRKIDDEVFDQPTQIITETDPKNHSNKMIDDDVFDQPTQIITETDPKNRSNEKIDNEVFDQPTQKILSSKENSSNLNQDNIFDQPTQNITNVVVNASNTIKNDIFVQPTQNQQGDKYSAKELKRKKKKAAKTNENASTSKDLKSSEILNQPAQKIVALDSADSPKLISVEESDILIDPHQPANEYNCLECQKIADEKEQSSIRLGLSIESQLEILFSSQPLKYTPGSESRPSNPIASVLETDNLNSSVETEDVITTSTKITSNDRDRDKTEKSKDVTKVNSPSESVNVSKDQSKNSSVLVETEVGSKSDFSKVSSDKQIKNKIIDKPGSSNVSRNLSKHETGLYSTRSRDKKAASKTKTGKNNDSKISENKLNKAKEEETNDNEVPTLRGNTRSNKKQEPVPPQDESSISNIKINENQETVSLSVPETARANTRINKTPGAELKDVQSKQDLKNAVQTKIFKNVFEEPSGSRRNNKRDQSKLKKDSLIVIEDSSENESRKGEEKRFKSNKKEPCQVTPSKPKRKVVEQEVIKIDDSSEDFSPQPTTSKLRKRKEINAIPPETPTKKQKLDTSTSSSDYSTTSVDANKRGRRPKKNVKTTIKEATTDKTTKLDLESSGSSSSKITATPVKNKIVTPVLDTPTRNKRKLKPKIVFTMLDSPELESLIRSLGGTIVDSVNASTVLVTQSLKRSQKLLAAIGQSKPICSPQWLHECKKANNFLDPWEFILEDKDAEGHWKVSLRESLRRSQNNKLLANFKVHLLVNNAVDVLKAAVESCGGKCITKVLAKDVNNLVIVSTIENKAKYARFLKMTPAIPIVAPEAIFDGVLRQELHLKDHTIV